MIMLEYFKINRIPILVGICGLLLFIGWFTYGFNYGERVQRADGLGWDGTAYAAWAQMDTAELLGSKVTPKYYMGRMLPSIIIHNVSKIVGYDIKSTARVIHAFYIYNFILIVIGIIVLMKIGNFYEWNLKIYYLAFAGIFLNFPVLKMSIYNPTLVDMTALILGLVTFYFYTIRKKILLSAIVFVSSFVWPSMLIPGLFLILFSHNKSSYKNNNILAVTITILAAAYAIYLYFIENLRLPEGVTQINYTLWPLSAILLFLYVFIGLRSTVDIRGVVDSLRKLKIDDLILIAIIFFLNRYVINLFSSNENGPLTIREFLGYTFQAGLNDPLVNCVAHIMTYGPFFIIALLLWSDFVKSVRDQGLGLLLYIGIFVIVSVSSESRQLINIWPFIVIIVCQVLNKNNISWYFVFAITGLCLILSRFWLKINVAPLTYKPGEFPDQLLFMHAGPWLSHQMYWVFLAVVLITLIAISSLLKLNNMENSRVK
jgi:hypothetical protein